MHACQSVSKHKVILSLFKNLNFKNMYEYNEKKTFLHALCHMNYEEY